MGHRHIFNTAQMFDPNDEQSWKHMHSEQPYGHFGMNFVSFHLYCSVVLGVSISFGGIHIVYFNGYGKNGKGTVGSFQQKYSFTL